MKKLILKLLLVSTLFASKECYEIVEDEARKWEINGKVYPTLVASIVEVESHCRQHVIGDLHTKAMSIGAGQIQVKTVYTVAKWYPRIAKEIQGLSDYGITAKLIKDIRFSTRIIVHYLKWYIEHDWSIMDAIIIYNGWWQVNSKGKAIIRNGKKVKNIQYYGKVIKAMKRRTK